MRPAAPSQFAVLLPNINTAVAAATSRIIANVTYKLAASLGSGAPAAALNPACIAGGIGSTTINFHPVLHYGIHTAISLSFIVNWIAMIAATSVQLQLYEAMDAAGVRRDHQACAAAPPPAKRVGRPR